MQSPLLRRFQPIRAFALDVDGVLTDGTLWIHENGEFIRRMHIRDGFALQLAVKAGYQVFVISGGTSTAVHQRLVYLGIREVHMGVKDKRSLLQELMKKHGIGRDEILYMGDDMPDLEVMQDAGLACCPSDAVQEIRDISAYVSPYPGGQGCVRDVIEKVMKLNGKWGTDAQSR